MAVSARCRAVSRSCSVTAEISSGKSRARLRSSAIRAASFRAQATLEASLRTVVSRMFVVGQLPPALTAIWKDEARARRPLASAVGGALSALLAWRQISSASASGSRFGPESSSGSSSSGEGSAVGRSAPASAVGKGSSTCWSREFSGRSTPLPGLIRVGPASVDVDIGSGVAADVGGSESQPASARPMATMEVPATPALIGSSDRLACGVRRTPDSRYRRERAPALGRAGKLSTPLGYRTRESPACHQAPPSSAKSRLLRTSAAWCPSSQSCRPSRSRTARTGCRRPYCRPRHSGSSPSTPVSALG